MTGPARPSARLAHRLSSGSHLTRQGAMLFSGFAASQACSFARNALIGHWLSRGDFGIAASITLTLQLCETLLDIGADRLIIQARDGNRPSLMASAHTVLVARGVATALVLYILAGPMTRMFAIPEAVNAFQAIAIVPLIKGFMHLDMRRYQRNLDNRPFLIVEAAPQMAALLATVPILWLSTSYVAVIWLAIIQATVAILAAHLVARRGYRFGFDTAFLARLWRFGWPIWLSALPLAAVYQGDRMIIGSHLGMPALADYSVAFMITMVPGLLAAKVGHALMLPMLAATKTDPAAFTETVKRLAFMTLAASLLYVAGFMLFGEFAVTLAFGQKYAGLSMLIAILALMWSLRMLQAVPGMALIAVGTTKPLLVAGLVRSTGLSLAYAAVVCGYGLVGVAAAGVLAELASLLYVTGATARHCPLERRSRPQAMESPTALQS